MRQAIFFGIVFLVTASDLRGQETLKGTKGTAYGKVAISPDNSYLLGLMSARKEDGGVIKEKTVHFFDRAKQSKETLVSFTAGGHLSSLGFSPTGEDMFVGGGSYFGAWSCPGKDCWFLRKGEQDVRNYLTVDAFVAPRRGGKIAYAAVRYRQNIDALPTQYQNEGKVLLWDLEDSSLHDVFAFTETKTLRPFFAFRLAISSSGDRLAHWNVLTKQLVVHDTAKRPFKALAIWDAKLANVHKVAFSVDEKSVWLLADQKLQQYDFAAKRILHSIDVGESAWFHPLGEKQIMVFQERKKNGPVVRFLDPTNKSEKRLEMTIDIWAPTLSPDHTLFAACGIDEGIYLWNVNDLRDKAN